jgi:hypothetical protein
MGTTKLMTLVPLFYLKFLNRIRCLVAQELRIGGTGDVLSGRSQDDAVARGASNRDIGSFGPF